MKDWNRIIGAAGLIVTSYAILSAIFQANPVWYSYFVVGGTLSLGYLNDRLGNASILQALAIDRTTLLLRYGASLAAAMGVEIVGRFVFHFWEYPTLSPIDQIVHLTLIQYSIGFFYLYEFFVLVQRKIRSFLPAFLLTAFANGVLIEVLNTLAPEWKYHIPFISNEIVQMAVAGTLGWTIMISIAIVISNLVLLRHPTRQAGHESRP